MALVNPNIAMSFRQPEFKPRNAMAEYAQMQQIQGGQQAQELARFKFDELKRDRAEMMQLQAKLKGMGQDPDLDKLMDVYVSSGRPDYVKMGLEGKQKLREQREYAKLVGGDTAAPEAAVAAPAAAPPVMRMPQAPAPTNALGSGTFDVGAPAAPVNALAAPVPASAAAPVNALATPNAGQIQQTQKRINDLMRFAASNPGMATQAMQQARLLQDQLELFSKPGVGESPDVQTMRALGIPITPAGYQQYRDAQRRERMLSPAEEAQSVRIATASRAPAAPRPEPAPRTQQVTMSDGTLGIVNMDTGVITPSTVGGAPVKGKASKDLAVSEQQASYNLGRILDAAKEINAAIKKDPDALKPGVGEAAAASVGLSGTANVVRNAQRQIVYGAQRDALDAMLYLATGAAYNKEQLDGQMAAYVPAFTDKSDAVEAKRVRMLGLIQNAKVRAGKAWTPEMDAASQALLSPGASKPAPAAAQGTGKFKYIGKESN